MNAPSVSIHDGSFYAVDDGVSTVTTKNFNPEGLRKSKEVT